jgi:hypothetical protein
MLGFMIFRSFMKHYQLRLVSMTELHRHLMHAGCHSSVRCFNDVDSHGCAGLVCCKVWRCARNSSDGPHWGLW